MDKIIVTNPINISISSAVTWLFLAIIAGIVAHYVNLIYPKLSKRLLLWFINRSSDGTEELVVHGSPRDNCFTLMQLKSDFNGVVSIDINYDESEGISLGSYNTKDSPMYLLTSFPVRLMFPLPFSENKYKQKWIEHGLSNGGFDLKAVSEIASINENIEVPTRISKPVNLWHIPRKYSCIRVDTTFDISSHYTGTKYKNKSVWWCYGIGPVKIEVDFDGVESCEGELVGCKIKNTTSFWPLDEGNEWIYLWRLSRPNNSKNISDPTKEVTTKCI